MLIWKLSQDSFEQRSTGVNHSQGNGAPKPDNHTHDAAHALAPAVVDDDDLAAAQLEYEMALKQAEILRLRHLTKKLERELQSTSRTSNGSEQRHNPPLALAESMDDQTTPGTKHRASPAPVQPGLHSTVLKTYEGKSFRELCAWVAEAEDQFASLDVPLQSDAVKIHHAIRFAASHLQQDWRSHEDNRGAAGPPRWKHFVDFLGSRLGDPVERKMKALQAYHKAMPRPNESVEDFKAYLARLEADLPPYTEEQRELHLQLRLRMAAQNRPPKHNVASHNTVSSSGNPVQNRAPQNTLPNKRHPNQNRGGQNAAPNRRHPNQNRGGQNAGPKRNHSGGQDREYEHPGPKRPRPTAPHDSIKRELDSIS
ncbi:MAG: hypothetical protein Q9172_002728 [Xanthocarpia lactea]